MLRLVELFVLLVLGAVSLFGALLGSSPLGWLLLLVCSFAALGASYNIWKELFQ